MKDTVAKFYSELKRSIEKHGNWDDYTLKQMWEKINDERQEVLDAEELEDYYGDHGVTIELLQMAVTCVKMSHQLIKRELKEAANEQPDGSSQLRVLTMSERKDEAS